MINLWNFSKQEDDLDQVVVHDKKIQDGDILKLVIIDGRVDLYLNDQHIDLLFMDNELKISEVLIPAIEFPKSDRDEVSILDGAIETTS